MGLTIWLDLNRQDSCGQIPSIVLVVIVLFHSGGGGEDGLQLTIHPTTTEDNNKRVHICTKEQKRIFEMICVKKRPKPYGTAMPVISAHM